MTDQSVSFPYIYSFLYIWLHREDVRDCGGLRSLRSLRTLPTFPAWSTTTCLRRAPLFGSQCLRRRNSRSMIAPWQMVSGGPSHFVGPFFSGANASRHHLPRSIADTHLHFNHYDPSHNLLRHGHPAHKYSRGIPAWRKGLLTLLRHGDPAHKCSRANPAWRRGLLTGLRHGHHAHKYSRAIPAWRSVLLTGLRHGDPAHRYFWGTVACRREGNRYC